MAISKRGNYYRYKTKAWFLEQGYECEYLEKFQRIVNKGKIVFSKRDIFGADGVAISKDSIIFWNSKLNRKHIAQGIKEFLKYPFPVFVKRWLIVWQPRVRQPEIIDVNEVAQ